jgi:hypothetical protein
VATLVGQLSDCHATEPLSQRATTLAPSVQKGPRRTSGSFHRYKKRDGPLCLPFTIRCRTSQAQGYILTNTYNCVSAYQLTRKVCHSRSTPATEVNMASTMTQGMTVASLQAKSVAGLRSPSLPLRQVLPAASLRTRRTVTVSARAAQAEPPLVVKVSRSSLLQLDGFY